MPLSRRTGYYLNTHIFYIYTKGTLYLLKTTETFTHDDDRNNNNNSSIYIPNNNRRTVNRIERGMCMRWRSRLRVRALPTEQTTTPLPTKNYTQPFHRFKRHLLSSFEILSGIPNSHRYSSPPSRQHSISGKYKHSLRQLDSTRFNLKCKRKIVDTIMFHFLF